MKRLRTVFATAVAGFAFAGAVEARGVTPPVPATESVRELGVADDAFRAKALERAELVSLHYKSDNSAWTLVTTAEQLMGKSPSGFDGALYRSGDKYSFAFYGYNHLNDTVDVIKVGFFGVPRKQLREAEAFTEKASATYGFNVSDAQIVGHSMGGYIAKVIGIHNHASEVWSFNGPGFKKRDLHRVEKLLGENAPGLPPIYNVNAKQDVVGLWGHQPGQVFEVSIPVRHHAMEEMEKALQPAGAPPGGIKPEKANFMTRVFNRVTGSAFVQKHLHQRFRKGPAAG